MKLKDYLELEGRKKVMTVQWFKGKLNAQAANLILTSKRILVEYQGNPLAGPLLKLLIKSQGRRIVFNAEFDQLASLEEEKYGINKVVLLKDGEGNEIRIGGVKADFLKDAIAQAQS